MPYDLTYMWNLKNVVQMNLLTEQQSHRCRKPTYGHQGRRKQRRERVHWDIGTDMCTLLYINCIAYESLLYATGNSSQYSVVTFMGKESKKEFCSVQSLSRFRLFASPWTEAHQASLSITNSRSLFKLMSIESEMPSNHLILCCPLLLLPSVFPSIRVFSNESVLCISWPNYWSFSFSISPSSEHLGLISIRMDSWISLLSKGL